MNKEQIKKFWEDHKVEIIGGTLVLVSLAVIGVSASSAINANKKALETKKLEATNALIAETNWNLYKKELMDVGAEFNSTEKWALPDATKEVAVKFLDRGDNYKLDIFNDHEAVIWIQR